MDEQSVAGRRLVELARPFTRRGDRIGLARALEANWTPDCLALMLDSTDGELVATAATALGLVADMPYCAVLAPLLHHRDDAVASAAEDALWSIWFRGGGAVAQAVLSRIARSIQAGETENIVPLLTELMRAHPDYAEVYHQRSQAHYLVGYFDLALRDARRAFELNPWHFGALANQAHALAALGRYHDALETYRRVLDLHPRMEGVRMAIDCLYEKLTPVGV